MAQSKPLLVVAIDIGTTYSGYAFSFQHEFLEDKLKITTNKGWEDGESSSRTSYKTPTSVLLTPQREFHSFGYEAERHYWALAERKEHKTWLLFRRFKMDLYKCPISDLLELEAVSGQRHNAQEVFAMSIRYLKDHFIRNLPGHVPLGGIHYVLTVPAIWKEEAKQFMRKAAIQAGVNGGNLTIALEPEAASIFCQANCDRQRQEGNSSKTKDFSASGSRYIVVDAGGGTVDTTVHEVMYSGELKELRTASGGDWGATQVDDKFTELLMEIFSPKIMKEFGRNHHSHWLQLEKEFEFTKRRVSSNVNQSSTFGLPSSLQELFCSRKACSLQEHTARSRFAGQVRFIGDKMRVSGEIMQSLLRPTVEKIVTHIRSLLQDPRCDRVHHILLVGGFSESPFLQEVFRMEFPSLNIVTPPDASLAVMKGAVIFGHVPSSIQVRLSKFTYGIQTFTHFVEGYHDPAKREDIEGLAICKDRFRKFLTVDEEVSYGRETDERTLYPIRKGLLSTSIQVFRSTDRDPMYITDPSCTLLGSFDVPMPILLGDKRRVLGVKFVLGGTELKVKAHEKTSGKYHEATFVFAEQ